MNRYNDKTTQNRIMWIDMAKGMAIILMVLGHISDIPGFLRVFIFSFHMPLFMILNGYTIKSYDIRETFKRSVRSLIKPYLTVAILEAVLSMIMSPDMETGGVALFRGLDDAIVGISRTSTMFTKYGSVWLIWFVICLFFARNIYVILRAMLKDRSSWLVCLAVGCLFVAGYYTGTSVAYLPWSLDVALVSVLFVAVGNYLRLYSEKIRKYQVIIALVCLAVWFYIIYTKQYIELAIRRYPGLALGALGAICGSIVIIGISMLMCRLGKITKFFSWYGRNCFIILSVHCLEMRFFKWNDWVFGPLGMSLSWYWEFAIRFVFITIVVFLFTNGREFLRRFSDRSTSAVVSRGDARDRLDWPDVAKGICIISVILGHLGIDFINRIVFMYHLPVFFLLAGYFLKKRPDGEFVTAKAKRLLIPYFVTCAAICVIGALRMDGSKKDTFVSWINASLYGAGDSWDWPFHINAIGAIWFLWALFWALIIVNYFVDKKFYRIIIFCIAFTGWASFDRTQVWLPLSIQAGMLASLYVLIGYEIRKNNLIEHLNVWVLIGCFLIYAWSIWSFKGFWLVHDYMGNGWIDFIASICAAIVIIQISRYICGQSHILRCIFGWFGRNSLIILCFHIIELNVLPIAKFIENSASAFPSLSPIAITFAIIVAKLIYVVCAAIAFKFVYKVVKRDL